MDMSRCEASNVLSTGPLQAPSFSVLEDALARRDRGTYSSNGHSQHRIRMDLCQVKEIEPL